MENVIIYDGFCNLCCGAAMFVKKRDMQKRFTFISRDSEEGKIILLNSGLSGKDLNTLIYFSSGQFYIRSSAVLHILKDLGGIWRLFYGFIIVPRFIADFVYIIVAKTRYYIFGKRDECFIPAD